MPVRNYSQVGQGRDEVKGQSQQRFPTSLFAIGLKQDYR